MIVGGATHNFTLEIGDGSVIQNTTKRARSKNVHLGGENIFVVAHRRDSQLLHSLLKRAAIHIARNHFGASFFAQLGNTVTRGANALHADCHSGKINLASKVFQARLHGVEATSCGERTWVATMTDGFTTHDVLSFLSHPIAELRRHTNIFRGDIRAIHSVNKATHRAALGLCCRLARLDQDHAFCAAHCKIGGGGFVGHAF